MPTPRQIVLEFLTDSGAQNFSEIFRLCSAHASGPIEESSIVSLLNTLIDARLVFSDGVLFAAHADEISTKNLVHCHHYLVKLIEEEWLEQARA